MPQRSRAGAALPPGATHRIGDPRLRPGGTIRDLRFSAEGARLAILGERALVLADAREGTTQHRVAITDGTCVAVRGEWIAIAHRGGVDVGRLGRRLTRVEVPAHAMRFSDDGSRLAIANRDEVVVLRWPWERPIRDQVIAVPEGWRVIALAMGRDVRWAAIPIDLPEPEPAAVGHRGPVPVAPIARSMVLGEGDAHEEVWVPCQSASFDTLGLLWVVVQGRIARVEPRRAPVPYPASIEKTASLIAADVTHLAALGHTALEIIAPREKAFRLPAPGTAVAVSDAARRVAVAVGHVAMLLDASKGKWVGEAGATEPAVAIAIDDQAVAIRRGTTLDLHRGRPPFDLVRSLPLPHVAEADLRLHEGHMVTLLGPGKVGIVNPGGMVRPLADRGAHDAQALSADGRLWARTNDDVVELVDLGGTEPVTARLPAPIGPVAWSPNGWLAAVAGGAVWRVTPDGATKRLSDIDAHLLAVGPADQVACARPDRVEILWEGHTLPGRATHLVWHGKTLIVATDRGELVAWRPGHGQTSFDSGPVTALAAWGRWVVTGHDDTTVLLWPVTQ